MPGGLVAGRETFGRNTDGDTKHVVDPLGHVLENLLAQLRSAVG